jgi:CheY-like chemotaxis protein
MILPNNGKVIIIDDDPKDVEDLTEALTREKMPFLFFKDPGLEDLPVTPINNVRLVFLDLELGLGGNNAIEKIRIVQQRIYRLIEPKTPYVLVIWSKHEDVYAQTLFDEFKNGFKDYAPLASCSLDKADIKKLKDRSENVLQIVRDRLKTELSKFNSFNLFLLWESIINDSCGEAVNSLINSSSKESTDINVELRTIIKKLANAYLGKRIEKADSETIQRGAMYTFNDLFKESIEKEIVNSSLIDGLEFSNVNSANIQLIAKLNSKLFFDTDVKSDISPGSVYLLHKEEQERISNEIKQKTKQPWIENIIHKKSLKDNIAERIKKSESREATTSEINSITSDLLKQVIENTILIETEISPVCDYAQNKRIFSRNIKGCLFPYGVIEENSIKSKAEYLYISPLFEYNSKMYKLVLDLRLFSSSYFDEKNESMPIFKLRHQLLAEIQINVSKHVSRTGLTYLDERDL